MKCNLEYYFTAGDVEDDSRTGKSTGDAQGKAQRKRLESDQTETFYFATVYRTLQLLYEIQLIDRIHFNDGCIRYEIGHIFDGDSKHSHHHLICRTCGRVMPFEDDFLEDLEAQIEADTGFHVLDHELKFYGQCKECAEASMRKENT